MADSERTSLVGDDMPFLDQDTSPQSGAPKPCRLSEKRNGSYLIKTIPVCKDKETQWLTIVNTSLAWALILVIVIASNPGPGRSPLTHPQNAARYGKFLGQSRLIQCPDSPEKAREAGCEYDILSNEWVPGACADPAAVKEYQGDGTWHGFADANRTEYLALNEMGQGPFYYTSMRDHIVHCAMLWRKQYCAFAEGRLLLDTTIADEEHTMHCSQFLMDMTENGPDYRSMPIKVFVGYGGCWMKDE